MIGLIVTMYEISSIILLAFLLDYFIGDPQNPFHPIRIIGAGISLGIELYKKINIKQRLASFVFGMIVVIIIISLTYIVTKVIIELSSAISMTLGFAIQVILCYFVIAPKALKHESMKVYYKLESNDIEGARHSLSYIVGRDTKELSPANIVRATVETIAENLSDGVIAPLIFVFIGGVPLGMAYKAINTLDSMIGYRNETYEYFGKFAARLDDIVNIIPSRISAIFMIIATIFTKSDTKSAIRIFFRDRYNHKSPNSAQTEAVCAGALGISLGGDNYYNGVLVHKPIIGDPTNEPSIHHIIEANKIMYAATALIILAMFLIF